MPSDSAAGISAQIFLARGHMYAGDQSEAESILKKAIANAEPTHPLRPRAEEILNDLSKLTGSNPSTIGVLLPLSGKFGKFGRLCLNAISMALSAFEEMPENKTADGLKLVVRDSGESAESATAAFEELGYNCYWFSAQKKGYSGVGIITKEKPLEVEYGCGMEQADFEGRVLQLKFNHLLIFHH